MSEWRLPEVAKEYAERTSNETVGWYEYLVNFPDLERLIPAGAGAILDFGCGAGDFTEKLSKKFATVVGTDIEPMVSIARARHPGLSFIEWDGSGSMPQDIGIYDVILSKLVIQFIEHLDFLAENFKKALTPNGIVIVSIPNPPRIAEKFHIVPDAVEPYDDEVGTTGIKIHPVYRSREKYIEIFTAAGFSIVEISEPTTPARLASDHGYPPDKDNLSRRLNIKMTKA